jgi:type II secretory pathway component PulM
MKDNERKLLLLFGILAALVVIVRVVPLAYGYYREGRNEIAQLEERVDRFRTLINEQGEWQDREVQKQAELAELEAGIFQGANANLIGSAVQRALQQAAAQAGIAVRETRVAQYRYVGEWLMVSQEVSFTLEQSQILPFLNAIEALRPRLHVADFNVTRTRRGFSGNITVVGFSRGAGSR